MGSHVTVSDLQHRPEHKSPWIVRWRVDGQGKARAFRTKLAADRYRGRLLAAEGEKFDTATGEPVSWARTEAGTFVALAQSHMRRRWDQWSAGQRRSAVESLMIASTVLIRPRARQRPEEERLRQYLRDVVLVPEKRAGDRDSDLDVWLERWSLPLEDLTVERAESVLEAYATKADGGACSPTTIARRRAVLYGALKAAVNRRLLDENPLDRSEWKPAAVEGKVDPARVPSIKQVRQLLTALSTVSSSSARTVAYGAMLGLAGLRPSEATALKVSDLTLPEEGWGMARLRNSITKTSSRYADENGLSERGLKKRKVDAVRSVPLAPELVQHLRRHLVEYPSTDGYVFSNNRGGRLTSSHFSTTFAYAVRAVFPEGPLSNITPYTLRHAAGSAFLKAGVSPADVAERLGHSVAVLLAVYSQVIEGEHTDNNALIEKALSE